MATIDSLLFSVQTFKDNLENGTYMSDIIQKYEAEICDMNSEQQLFEQGINRVGVDIMDYAPYSPVTIDYKMAMGQPYNRVTLRDTGDFHGSFEVRTNDKGFEIVATDEKTEWLTKKYGNQILGLTDENAEELTHEYIYPELMQILKDTL